MNLNCQILQLLDLKLVNKTITENPYKLPSQVIEKSFDYFQNVKL